ncbi:MAG: FG-GAP repeat protein [Ignavibacteria bacterium]|nr:FG-GAP repeat protein [Ignavibacteria bacterium]
MDKIGFLTISIFIVAAGAGDINGDGFDDIFYSSPKIGTTWRGYSVFILRFFIWFRNQIRPGVIQNCG